MKEIQLFCQLFTLKAKYWVQLLIGGGECNKGIRSSKLRLIGAVNDVIMTKNTPNWPKNQSNTVILPRFYSKSEILAPVDNWRWRMQ